MQLFGVTYISVAGRVLSIGPPVKVIINGGRRDEMSKLQHTPGPWDKDYNGTIGHIKTLCKPDVHTKTIIKYRYNMCEEILTEEEIEANARLIAAAPEMLEALIWFVRRVRNGEVHSKRTYARYVEIIEKATGMSIEEVLSE